MYKPRCAGETREMDNILIRSWCFIWAYFASKPELQA